MKKKKIALAVERGLVLLYSDIFLLEDGRSIKASLFLFNLRFLSISRLCSL